MRRKLGILALLVSVPLLLSACDKCGGFQDIRVPGAPHACKGDAAR